MESSFDERQDTGYHDQRWDDSSTDRYRSRPGDIDELSSGGYDTYESDLNVLDILNTLRVVGGSAHPVTNAPWPRHDAEAFSIISSAQQPGVPQSRACRHPSPLVKPLLPRTTVSHDGGRNARQLAAAPFHAPGHGEDHQDTPKAHLSNDAAIGPLRAHDSRLPGTAGTPMRRSHAAAPCVTPMRRSLAKQQTLLKVGELQRDTLPCMHACELTNGSVSSMSKKECPVPSAVLEHPLCPHKLSHLPWAGSLPLAAPGGAAGGSICWPSRQ